MVRRWILYLLAWLVGILFYCSYLKWFGWIALLAILALPVFSLLVSLPAMLTARLSMEAPGVVSAGEDCFLKLRCRSSFPLPVMRCRVYVQRLMTGEEWELTRTQKLPTEHCGTLVCTVEKARIYDYLGLFFLPLRCQREKIVTVRPKPVPMELPRALRQEQAVSWRPKRGGGYAENHELRLYRPGDSVQQIHWKLSAKTGRLILREPQVPEQGMLTLRLRRGREPQELDRSLGRLLWLGEKLLEQGVEFRILCQGMCIPVRHREELLKGLDKLLSEPVADTSAPTGRLRPGEFWIGGGIDEG